MRPFALAMISLSAGCFPDDWTGEPYTGPGTGGDTGPPGTVPLPTGDAPAIVGRWSSEGEDVADLLAEPPFSYRRVEAVFDADGSYVVTSEDATGTETPLSGTWSADDGTAPATIHLDQAAPYVAEAEGIWQVGDDGAMTYEVVQTVPDYGFTPPTPADGFGSTGGPGMTPGINVQIYRRSP